MLLQQEYEAATHIRFRDPAVEVQLERPYALLLVICMTPMTRRLNNAGRNLFSLLQGPRLQLPVCLVSPDHILPHQVL